MFSFVGLYVGISCVLYVGSFRGKYEVAGSLNSRGILDLLQSPPFRQQMDSFTCVRNARPMLLVLFLVLLMIVNFTRLNSSFCLKVLRTGHIDLSQFRINL